MVDFFFLFKNGDNGGIFAQLIRAFPYLIRYCRLRINAYPANVEQKVSS